MGEKPGEIFSKGYWGTQICLCILWNLECHVYAHKRTEKVFVTWENPIRNALCRAVKKQSQWGEELTFHQNGRLN